LRDVETKAEVAVSISGDAADRYRSRLEALLAEAAGRARRVGMDYLLVTAAPGAVDRALLDLVAAGVVR
jgi:hypothetical protein